MSYLDSAIYFLVLLVFFTGFVFNSLIVVVESFISLDLVTLDLVTLVSMTLVLVALVFLGFDETRSTN